MFKNALFIGFMTVLLAGCSLAPKSTQELEREGWVLVWQDEFDGDVVDPDRWVTEIGGHGWGNNEKQFYTNFPENVRLEKGNLVIEAREEFFVRRNYTSGRINTQEKFSFTYGRVETRMKLPFGQGIWPAFWMLGADFEQVGWPLCGEIDIMEHIGRQPRQIFGTVHGPGYSGGGGVGHFTTFPENILYEEFHVYAIEWEPEVIRWYVDDELFFTLTPDQVPNDWVFDKPFFILINLAVGGNWPGNPDDSTVFPQFLTVDYVRVYQRPEAGEDNQSLESGTVFVNETAASAIDGADGWANAESTGETSDLTEDNGKLTLATNFNKRFSEIMFCVTGIGQNNFSYDMSTIINNCTKIES